ncbi:MAG: type III pantothenate kinase [Gammaproteobacteria bacterium]|jgi:type III pantothenate kinase|nr:type III pantothenate kinase [Gammaproteobacteria bacterium]
MNSAASSALLLDVGNTRIKWQWRDQCPTSSRSVGLTSGSLEDLQAALLQRQAAAATFTAAGICVANAARRACVEQLLQLRFGVTVDWLSTRARVADLICAYADPTQLGVDRWAVLAGARSLYPQDNVIIADCGSATTIDFLQADGLHLGGWIVTGLQDSLLAISQRLQHLPVLNDHNPASLLLRAQDQQSPLANETLSAMALGAVHAQAGLLEHANMLAPSLGWSNSRLLLTGGDAERILPRLRETAEWQPALVFIGIAWLQAQQ